MSDSGLKAPMIQPTPGTSAHTFLNLSEELAAVLKTVQGVHAWLHTMSREALDPLGDIKLTSLTCSSLLREKADELKAFADKLDSYYQ